MSTKVDGTDITLLIVFSHNPREKQQHKGSCHYRNITLTAFK